MTNNKEDQTNLTNIKYKETELSINFAKILKLYWKDKFISLIILILFIIISIFYIKNTPFKYEVSLNLIQIENSSNAGTGSQYSNVARVFGINLGGSSGNSNFSIYKSLMQSKLISQLFVNDQDLMKQIFKNSWDHKNKKFLEKEKDFITKIKNSIKKLVGIPIIEGSYKGDDAIYDMLKAIEIIPGASSSIIELSYTTTEPMVGKILLENAHNFSDKFLKERSKSRTEEYIAFLTEKLNQNTNQNIRLSLIQTLSGQHKSLMVSSSSLAYTAEKFGEVEISPYPVSPRPRLIFSLTIVSAILFSFFVSVFKSIILGKNIS